MWWKQAIIYELYVDKFADDFRRLTGKLNYLKRLGVNCIHLLPHYPSPMVDGGYDVSDYKGVRKELGTLSDFEAFVKRAHDSDTKIIIDLALNHTSTSHPWFLEARSSPANPKRDYYLWGLTGKEFPLALNAFPFIKPNNWIYEPKTNSYYFATFYPAQADLNWNNTKVLEEILSVIDFWAALGVDGFRLDAAAHLIKKEGTTCTGLPETHEVLRKIRSHLGSVAPEVVLLAEADASQPLDDLKSYFGDGNECQMVYNFSLTSRIFLAVMRNDHGLVQELFAKSTGIPANCSWAVFLRNHDELSLETFSEDERQELIHYCDPRRQYIFGNSLAVRTATAFQKDPKKIVEAFRLLFQSPGSPIIYYGEEIGMKNDLHRGKVVDRREYVRGAFDWNEAFLQMKDPSSLWSSIRDIIKERKNAREI